MSHILAIDQGTTSSRAIVFDAAHGDASPSRRRSSRSTSRSRAGSSTTRTTSGRASPPPAAARSSGPGSGPATSPRSASPTSARRRWSGSARPAGRSGGRSSGRTGAPAPLCAELRAAGHEAMVTAKTGLLLDPYFSGTKLRWLLDAHEGARERARRGELLFGTVDSFLIWKLTGGAGARHRRDQRGAHAPLQHPPRRLGPRDLRPPRHPARDAARGARLRRRVRDDARRPLRPRDPDPRRRRRPAGGDGRAGLLRARDAEVDLRHRLLRGAQHRRRRRSRAATGC